MYSSTKDGKSGLFSVLADGTGQPELVIASDTRSVATSFTPDGKTLVVHAAGEDEGDDHDAAVRPAGGTGA